MWVGILVLVWIKMLQIHKETPLLFRSITIGLFVAWTVILWLWVRRIRKKFLQTKTVDQMKEMDWREFEKFIAFVFKKKWFKAKTRKWTNDWGIDVDATKNGQRYAIQCKKWKKL